MPQRDYYLPPRALVSQQNTQLVEGANVPRSTFKNRYQRLTAFSAGYLTPFLCIEVMPGDHFRFDIYAYVRMQTPIFPIFSNQNVLTELFFCPARLLWKNWKRMMGEQDSPGDSIDYTVPILDAPDDTDITANSIFDHMGLPKPAAGQTLDEINALPFRMYNLVWNTWYRDENIQNTLSVYDTDGPDDPSAYLLRRRAKMHDYFTSALPWLQKFTAPTVPLAGQSPVLGIGVDSGSSTAGSSFYKETPATAAANYAHSYRTTDIGTLIGIKANAANGYPAVYADLSQGANFLISTFRQAIMIQALLERDARGGTRYTELIRAHFGVINPDFRLQRPEYIGGGNTPLNTTPIAQTAPTAGAPLGALGGATTASGKHHASYAATEHGYILGLISIRTELAYQQGIHRMWTRRSRYDFPWPSLALLSEQAVYRREIYATGVNNDDITIFGYQERYHEFRTRYSQVTGLMRSTFGGTIDPWHLAQKFTSPPTLSDAFIQDTPPMDRVLAAGSAAADMQYIADILIDETATRPLPTFGTPATLGRF